MAIGNWRQAEPPSRRMTRGQTRAYSPHDVITEPAIRRQTRRCYGTSGGPRAYKNGFSKWVGPKISKHVKLSQISVLGCKMSRR